MRSSKPPGALDTLDHVRRHRDITDLNSVHVEHSPAQHDVTPPVVSTLAMELGQSTAGVSIDLAAPFGMLVVPQ